MDFSEYNDQSLREMVEQGLTVPPSCVARAKRLGLLVSNLSQRAAALSQVRENTLQGSTPQEAARALGPPWTAKRIRKHLRRGLIPGKKISGHWYVNQEWMETKLEFLKDYEDE